MRIVGGILLLIGMVLAIVGGGAGGLFYMATMALAESTGDSLDFGNRLLFSLFFVVPIVAGGLIFYLGVVAVKRPVAK